MLSNNNRAFVRSLSWSCLKTSKNRNFIAVIAIILTTMLFTSVATILEGSEQTSKEQMIRTSGSKFMMSIKYISQEASDELEQDPAFSKVGKLQYLGSIDNQELRKIPVDFVWANKTLLDGFFVEMKAGKLPEKENEVLVDTVILEMMGVPAKIGEKIPFHYEVNGEQRRKTMKVAGIYKGEANETNSTVYVSRAFFDKEMTGISVPSDGTAAAGSICLYVSFPSEKDLSVQRSQVLKKAGFDPDAQQGEQDFVIANINPAYDGQNAASPGLIAAAIFMALVIILAGYLIISNIFRISLLKDLRMYGQLKTIGASPKQLRRLMVKQADFLNLIGIPLGLALGYILGKGLLPVIMRATVYDDVREIEPRLLVFAASALFSFVTVRISCRKPIKLMARMSPIQALRYQGDEAGKSKQAKGRESKHRIFQMALSNFTGSKGKSFFVVLSLSLSVVILNSVLNFTNCFDQETFVRGQSGADFVVSHLDFGVSSESEHNVIPQAFLTEASKRRDVEKEGAVYCYQPPDDVAESALSESNGDYDGILTAKVRTVNGKPYTLRRELGKMLFAFDQEVWKRCKVVSGQLDMEKLKTGKYIVEVSEFINNGQDYDESLFSLKPGDKVNAVIGDTKLEYEVLANVVVQPMMLFSSSMGEGGYLALPSEEYLKLFPGKLPIHYVMDAKGDSFDDINAFLKNYEEKAQANIKYTSTEKIIQDYKDFKGIYASTGTILAAIFGIIGLLNLLNVILASAAARQREFAIMQSIGMTRKQLRRLFVIEGLLYSAVAGVLSLILASVLSWTVVRQLCGMEWFCVYHFSLLPATVLIPIYLVMSAAMAFVIDRLWNNGSIVERLRVSK